MDVELNEKKTDRKNIRTSGKAGEGYGENETRKKGRQNVENERKNGREEKVG